MDFSNDKNINNLSNLELFYYVYSKVLDFDKKNILPSEQTINPLTERAASNKLVKDLADALESVNISCFIVKAKKSIKNFEKNIKTNGGGHDALVFAIDDPTYLASGIYYADPILDTKNSKSRTICHSLLRLSDASDLLSKNGKYEIDLLSHDSLEKQIDFLDSLDIAYPKLRYEDLKHQLSSDEDFKNGLNFYIEQFLDDVYEMKAKDKSVNKYIHPYFGEGTKPYDTNISKIFIQVFEALFKRACARKLNHIVKDLDRPVKQNFEKYFEETDNLVKDAKVLVKIFSENYEGVTPQTFNDVMQEGIIDGDYFSNGSSYFNDYKYVSDLERLIINHNNLEQVASDYFTTLPELEEIQNALLVALKAQGKNQKQAENLAEKVMFGSMLLASSSWNTNSLNAENASPFAVGLIDSQQTKY